MIGQGGAADRAPHPPHPPWAEGAAERGMVTVELAMSSLVVAGALALVGWVLVALLVLDQCQVTANEVARQSARGDSRAVERASQDAPSEAEVDVRHEAGATVVVVRADAPPPFGRVVPLEARAVVLDEARS